MTMTRTNPTTPSVDYDSKTDRICSRTPEASPPASPTSRTRRKLFTTYWCVFLVALQFGLDSTLWLASALPFLQSIVGVEHADRYLSYAQMLPAAVQVLVSLFVGPIAGKIGSLKWPIIALVCCSAGGNLLYSCAGQGCIGSPWAVIGGRMLSGLASGSSSLAMSYLVISSSPAERLEVMSMYRTGAGVALVLGPLLSVPLSRISVEIGGYVLDGRNAPTAVSFLVSLFLVVTLVVFLDDKAKASPNALVALMQALRSRDVWVIPASILVSMLISAYGAADVMYLLSERLSANWNFNVTLISGFQAIVYTVSLIGSFGAGPLRAAFARHTAPTSGHPDEAKQEVKVQVEDGQSKEEAMVETERSLTVVSFLASLVGLLVLIIAFAVDDVGSPGNVGTAIAFLIGCALIMCSYNMQAAALPTLFSKSLPTEIRAALTPWYAVTVAAGKIVAPIIDQSVAEAVRTPRNGGYLTTRAIGVVLAVGAIGLLTSTRRALVRSCTQV